MRSDHPRLTQQAMKERAYEHRGDLELGLDQDTPDRRWKLTERYQR